MDSADGLRLPSLTTALCSRMIDRLHAGHHRSGLPLTKWMFGETGGAAHDPHQHPEAGLLEVSICGGFCAIYHQSQGPEPFSRLGFEGSGSHLPASRLLKVVHCTRSCP